MSYLQTESIKGGNELAWGFIISVRTVLEWSLDAVSPLQHELWRINAQKSHVTHDAYKGE